MEGERDQHDGEEMVAPEHALTDSDGALGEGLALRVTPLRLIEEGQALQNAYGLRARHIGIEVFRFFQASQAR